MRYVALLRGVNVGGITIKNADLKALFEALGLTAVRTVLASGNVIFESPEPAAALKRRIEVGLSERFGYDAWIVLVSGGELARVAAGYPFERDDAECHPYVVFGSDAGSLDEASTAVAELHGIPDKVQRGEGVIYWQVPRGATLDSPFGKLLGRPRYKPYITSRNLRTVLKLLD